MVSLHSFRHRFATGLLATCLLPGVSVFAQEAEPEAAPPPEKEANKETDKESKDNA